MVEEQNSKSSKKKAVKKKMVKKKASPKKKSSSKLGHDPLSWIDENDAEKLKKQNQPVNQTTEGRSGSMPEEKVAEGEEVSLEEPVDQPEVSSEEVTPAVESEKSEDENMLDLPVYFGIAQVADVYQQMKSIIESDSNAIDIKAGDIESIDTAALQLLSAFIKQAEENNKSVSWSSRSEKIDSAIAVLNMAESLSVAS